MNIRFRGAQARYYDTRKDAAIGKKAAPGPLYHVKSHLWAALAVALAWHDQHSL